MILRRAYKRTFLPLLLWAVSALVCGDAAAARAPREDLWRTSDALVSRLAAEWYKIGVLRRELMSITDVVSDLRNLELFPGQITRMSDKDLVEIDKRLEDIEKRHKKISARVDEFPAPLADAVRIVREMAVDKPVKDMIRLLEQGDMERVEQMLEIKHSIDALWLDVDSITGSVNAMMGFPPFTVESGEELDRVFFEILRANLGRQSDEYFVKINRIKDSLAVSRCDDVMRRQAFNTEMHLLEGYVKQKKWSVALLRAGAMKGRYNHTEAAARIESIIARSSFALGDFEGSLEAARRIPTDAGHDSTRILFAAQSLYELKEYKRIWALRNNIDFTAVPPLKRNLVLWIFMESGLAMGVDAEYSVFAEKSLRDMPYHLNVMHALARSFLAEKEYETSVSVLESAMQFPVKTDSDRDAKRKILLTLARVRYEKGEYDKALSGYFELLADEKDFEEALFGMAWCYIRQGMFPKAETTLRKLINQNPSHPLAAEAILLMGQRYLGKAQFEWRKTTYLSREYDRLKSLSARLDEKSVDSTAAGAEKLKTVKTDVLAMISRIEADSLADYGEIAGYYEKTLDICKLVRKYYETGSFQEVRFTESRERLLRTLDSVLVAVDGAGKSVASQAISMKRSAAGVDKVKDIVRRGRVLAVEADIDRYRWEREFAEWRKSEAAAEIKIVEGQLETAADSVQLSKMTSKRAELAVRIDSLIATEDRLRVFWFERITAACNDALKSNPDTTDEIYLRYHQGELWYYKENAAAAAMQAVFDSAAALAAKSLPHDTAILLKEPEIEHRQSIEQFCDIIKKYPDCEDIAPAVYSLAWCYSDLGMFDSALAQMNIVADKFPGSIHAPQAWMYLGEHFFEAEELENAIEAYQSVLKYPESEWFDEALYKLAWSYYRRSNPDKAISSFLALVDLGEGRVSGRSILEDESINYIAISFSESDPAGGKGLEQAALFADKLNDPVRGAQILHRLANVYRQQGRFDLAGKAYKKLLQKYPSSPDVARYENDYISVVQREQNLEGGAKIKHDFFRKYNHAGAWAKAQKDTAVVKTADSLAAIRLHETAVAYHQLALQQGSNAESYGVAAKAYDEFIRAYPDSPAANECQYNLAEISFSTGDYQKATEEYMAVSKRYPDGKFKENAAWNAIVASQNLLKQEGAIR